MTMSRHDSRPVVEEVANSLKGGSMLPVLVFRVWKVQMTGLTAKGRVGKVMSDIARWRAGRWSSHVAGRNGGAKG